MRAVGLDAVRRSYAHGLNDAERIGLLHLDNAHIQPVTDRRLRDEHCHPFKMPDAVSFCGHARDLERHDLVFTNCALLLRRHYLDRRVPQPAQKASPDAFSLPQFGQKGRLPP